jgi:ribosomal protein S18 acetylase RimI-like enzyme
MAWQGGQPGVGIAWRNAAPARPTPMTTAINRPPRDAIGLRPCTDGDVPFLRYLYGTTREGEMCRQPGTVAERRRAVERQFMAQQAYYEEHYPACEFLVIELQRWPIGRLYVDRGERAIRITDIALVPEARGRGIGRLLIEEILAEGRSTGKTVTLLVEHDNPARRLYLRLGFRHVDTSGAHDVMEWRATPPASRT